MTYKTLQIGAGSGLLIFSATETCLFNSAAIDGKIDVYGPKVVFRSMKFLSPEFALYLFKSSIRPCMEYCCLA